MRRSSPTWCCVILRSVSPAPTFHPVTYLTGVHNRRVLAAAQRRRDIGLLVTPLVPHYCEIASEYPVVGVDNGVFSAVKRFSPTRFIELLDRTKRWREKVRFVAAPDVLRRLPGGRVVGDAAATLEQFSYWARLIHKRDLPVALVGQNGLELMLPQIPWGEFEVLFLGGCTDWKLGRINSPEWKGMLQQFHDRGIPVHMGRVNSYERLEIAGYDFGVSSVDGTCLRFHPGKNLPELEAWLTVYNQYVHHQVADGADLDWYVYDRKERIRWEKRCYGWSETELFGEVEEDTWPERSQLQLFEAA